MSSKPNTSGIVERLRQQMAAQKAARSTVAVANNNKATAAAKANAAVANNNIASAKLLAANGSASPTGSEFSDRLAALAERGSRPEDAQGTVKILAALMIRQEKMINAKDIEIARLIDRAETCERNMKQTYEMSRRIEEAAAKLGLRGGGTRRTKRNGRRYSRKH